MRDIRFRAWDKKLKQFILKDNSLWNLISFSRNDILLLFKQFVYKEIDWEYWEKRVIFQQFTGLFDKNGKEIWEGDIIRNKEELLEVVFNQAYAQFQFINPNKMYEYPDLNKQEIEVIGNIFENESLLNK